MRRSGAKRVAATGSKPRSAPNRRGPSTRCRSAHTLRLGRISCHCATTAAIRQPAGSRRRSMRCRLGRSRGNACRTSSPATARTGESWSTTRSRTQPWRPPTTSTEANRSETPSTRRPRARYARSDTRSRASSGVPAAYTVWSSTGRPWLHARLRRRSSRSSLSTHRRGPTCSPCRPVSWTGGPGETSTAATTVPGGPLRVSSVEADITAPATRAAATTDRPTASASRQRPTGTLSRWPRRLIVTTLTRWRPCCIRPPCRRSGDHRGSCPQPRSNLRGARSRHTWAIRRLAGDESCMSLNHERAAHSG